MGWFTRTTTKNGGAGKSRTTRTRNGTKTTTSRSYKTGGTRSTLTTEGTKRYRTTTRKVGNRTYRSRKKV